MDGFSPMQTVLGVAAVRTAARNVSKPKHPFRELPILSTVHGNARHLFELPFLLAWNRLLTYVLTALTLALLPHNIARAAFFSAHVEGQIIETNLQAGGIYDFTVDIDECKWLIKIVPVNPDYSYPAKARDVVTIPDEIVASSDSEFFYCTQTFTNHHEVMRARGDLSATVPILSGNARRGPGSIPYAIDDKVILLWYAFGSHCFFAERARQGKLPPMENLDLRVFMKKDFFLDADWRLLDAPPKLPSFLITSNFCDRPSEPFLSAIQSGWPNTNVIFQTRETVRVGDFTVPKEVSITQFMFTFPSNTIRTRVYGAIQIITRKASVGSLAEEFKPPYPGHSFFEDLGPLEYGATAGFAAKDWPDDRTVRKSAANSLVRNVHENWDNQPKRKVTVWFKVGFTLLSLAALCTLFLLAKNNKTKHQKKQTNKP
jgi:hypothetical protein